jgi:hypothetical protein
MANHLTIAVAGSGKTQGIVKHCASLSSDRSVVVLTFTQTNQAELHSRLRKYVGDHQGIEVMGWFAFLMRHFARPFFPFKFQGKRIEGFNFEGRPFRMAKGINRFLDSNGAVYACELGRLAHELVAASKGALMHRLESIYDEVLIDEVQDLSSHDWEIVDVLLRSSIDVSLVGDVRQSVLATNPRSSKNRRYAYAEAIKWFRDRESHGLLEITESVVSWRCRPEIAAFSDTIFDTTWSFPKTKSNNQTLTGHDGVFLLLSKHVSDYVRRFQPQCLRSMAKSGKAFDLDYLNFKVAKGLTRKRVLIAPTEGISKFIKGGTLMEPLAAASFYVAVTRAAQSVAIIIDDPGRSTLPYWQP